MQQARIDMEAVIDSEFLSREFKFFVPQRLLNNRTDCKAFFVAPRALVAAKLSGDPVLAVGRERRWQADRCAQSGFQLVSIEMDDSSRYEVVVTVSKNTLRDLMTKNGFMRLPDVLKDAPRFLTDPTWKEHLKSVETQWQAYAASNSADKIREAIAAAADATATGSTDASALLITELRVKLDMRLKVDIAQKTRALRKKANQEKKKRRRNDQSSEHSLSNDQQRRLRAAQQPASASASVLALTLPSASAQASTQAQAPANEESSVSTADSWLG